MTSTIQLEDFKTELLMEIDSSTQEQSGKDIDVLISEISKINFKNLTEDYALYKDEKNSVSEVKYSFTLTSICFAVIAVIGAIATIIFSTGAFSPGAATLAVVTGFVGISTSFNQLDNAIARYLNFQKENKLSHNPIKKLADKVDTVKKLIAVRIDKIQYLSHELRMTRSFEILTQIKKVNEFVGLIKKEVPEKISYFGTLDPSPLLKYAG